MDAFEASALIQAPADRVWAILEDAPRYPDWDSGVTSVQVNGLKQHAEAS